MNIHEENKWASFLFLSYATADRNNMENPQGNHAKLLVFRIVSL